MKVGGGGALLLAPFFARSLTLVPRSLLLNRRKTLATRAIQREIAIFLKILFIE